MTALLAGDCLDVLPGIPERSIDAVVTDPPYHLTGKPGGRGGFMGKEWDGGDIAFRVETWQAIYRVLKPGGYVAAFGGTRTFHRLMVAIEDAGFEIRDTIGSLSLHGWVYGSGFPKSKNLDNDPTFCRCSAVQYSHDNESQDVRSVQPGVGTPDSLSGHPQQDLFSSVRQVDDEVASEETRHAQCDVRSVLEGISPTAESPGAGQGPGVLIPVRRQAPGVGVGEVLREHEGAQAEGWPLRSGQPGLEGWGDVLQDPRQLRRRQVRTGAAVGTPDGASGRLHHGASPPDGSDVRLSALSDGSGQPHRPRSSEQRPEELGALPDAGRPQAGRGRPLCDGCGKPRIPKGYGTALKPAWEPIVLARKPLEGTVAANFLKYGTGALDIDGCRIHTAGSEGKPYTVNRLKPGATLEKTGGSWRPTDGEALPWEVGRKYEGETKDGRWPANVVLSHEDGCREVGTKRVKKPGGNGAASTDLDRHTRTVGEFGHQSGFVGGHYDAGGLETVTAWECAPECAVRLLDEQSGFSSKRLEVGVRRLPRQGRSQYQDMAQSHVGIDNYPDRGGASRFFYCAKASPAERGAFNDHPTVKPLALMRWLVRLVTSPGGSVLDPFCGSGSTLIAADREGFSATGIDSDPHAIGIARRRLAEDAGLFANVEAS